MPDRRGGPGIATNVPAWVPEAAVTYLEHTEVGASIRALARRKGCHASTVSRQVRSFEARREDFLVDDALRRLGACVKHTLGVGSPVKETAMTMPTTSRPDEANLTEDRLKKEARRVLRRMCETGAVLAVAAEMDKAVVVRDTDSGSHRTAVVDRDIAEAMALKDWICCDAPGRIARYRITGTGRTALGHMVAEAENAAVGFAEDQAAFAGAGPAWQGASSQTPSEGERARRARYASAESPLILLARRRDKTGHRFLSPDLVRAGERLREDFELSGLRVRADQTWDQFLSAALLDLSDADNSGPARARGRVIGALRDLGPGLGDVALRCCCLLEGLESAERRMGWSARSGKIVLRIALQRLKRHYEGLGEAGALIG